MWFLPGVFSCRQCYSNRVVNHNQASQVGASLVCHDHYQITVKSLFLVIADFLFAKAFKSLALLVGWFLSKLMYWVR